MKEEEEENKKGDDGSSCLLLGLSECRGGEGCKIIGEKHFINKGLLP